MRNVVLTCVGIIILTLAVYSQTRSFDFVNYDDGFHVYRNLDLRQGLSAEGLQSALTANYMGNWAPVSWLTYHADYVLHGYRPGGYHLTNVLFHLLNSLLLFAFLRYTTGAIWPSAMAALFFAAHPLHVESVAWISERRDVVCTFFSLLTLMAYVGYARNPSKFKYLVVGALLIFSLLSKPMAVTLPFVLVLLDYWPLDRWIRDKEIRFPGLKRSLREKTPLIGIVVLFSALTFWNQSGAKAVSGTDVFSMPVRVANGAVAYGTYLIQSVFPVGLIPFYPHPGAQVSWALAILSAFMLLSVTLIVYLHRRTRPYLAVGWLWFAGMLVPVIGLIQVGGQAHADRYMYFPIVGLFIMIFWFLHEERRTDRFRFVSTTACLVVLSAFAALAHGQTARWKNSITLFEYTLTQSPDNLAALGNLGEGYLAEGDPDKALAYIERAVELEPTSLGNLRNLGQAYRDKNDLARSEQIFRRALEQDPNDPATLNQLGVTLLDQGRPQAALAYLNRALDGDADELDARVNRGNALLAAQRVSDAIADYSFVLARNPDLSEARSNLGAAYLMLKRYEDANRELRAALAVRPDDVVALVNLAVAELGLGHTEEAEKLCREALRIDPEYEKGKRFLRYLLQGGDATGPVSTRSGNVPDTLPGHTWLVGDMMLEFQDGGNVLVKGGTLANTMPSGAPSRYSLSDGILQLDVLGRSYDGRWDGQTLTIGGTPGTYLKENGSDPTIEVLE